VRDCFERFDQRRLAASRDPLGRRPHPGSRRLLIPNPGYQKAAAKNHLGKADREATFKANEFPSKIP
jgi:hypothetical protein